MSKHPHKIDWTSADEALEALAAEDARRAAKHSARKVARTVKINNR